MEDGSCYNGDVKSEVDYHIFLYINLLILFYLKLNKMKAPKIVQTTHWNWQNSSRMVSSLSHCTVLMYIVCIAIVFSIHSFMH